MPDSSQLAFLLPLSCAAFWAVAVIFFKQAGDGISAGGLNLYKNLVAVVFLLLTILLVRKGPPLAIAREAVLPIVLSGLVGIALADAMFFKTLRLLGASRTAVVDLLYTPFITLYSWVLLGDTLRMVDIPIFALILTGVLISAYTPGPKIKDPKQITLGIVIGASGMLLMTGSVIFVDHYNNSEPLLEFTLYRLLAGLGGSLVYMGITRGPRLASIPWKTLPWWRMTLGAFFGSYLAMVLWLGGFRYGPAPVVAVLNQTSTFFIVVLAAIFLGERLTRRKVLGAVLSFVGVLLLMLAGDHGG